MPIHFLKFNLYGFLKRAEGGCVSHVRPEHLLDLNEFKCWTELSRKQRDVEESSGYKKFEPDDRDSPDVSVKIFPFVSKKAWLDCLLQLLKVNHLNLLKLHLYLTVYFTNRFVKVCVLNRITPKVLKSMTVPFNKEASFPDVKSDPLTSNVISWIFFYFF